MFSFLTNRCVFTLALLCLIFPVSCTEETSEGERTDRILKTSKGGDFRGVNIGDRPEDVMKMEDAESVYSMPDELLYRIPPDSKDSTWYEISYNFDKDGLYDIQMDIYPNTDSGINALRNDFIQYYISKYGDCKHTDGYCEWRSMTDNGRIVSITLADTVMKKVTPCLRVNFNERKE